MGFAVPTKNGDLYGVVSKWTKGPTGKLGAYYGILVKNIRFAGSNPDLPHQIIYGSLAEWSKAADLKSVGGAEPSVGSNPTTPAIMVCYFPSKK